MYKLVVAIAALLLYVPAFFGHIVLTVVGSLAVVILGLLSCCLGLAVNYHRPRLAAFAIGGWTLAWIVVLAGVCVVLAWLGIRVKDASPATASGSVKLGAALAAAVLAALLAWLLDGRPLLTGGGVAKWRLQTQFTTWFPSQPQAPKEGIAAWQVVSRGFFETEPKAWGFRFRSILFQTVKAAMDVQGYSGGSAWKVADPPRENPEVKAVANNPGKPPATPPTPSPPPPPPQKVDTEAATEQTGDQREA
jgi:hypothetical protein